MALYITVGDEVIEPPCDKVVAWEYEEYVWATGLCDYVWRKKIEDVRPTHSNDIRNLRPLVYGD